MDGGKTVVSSGYNGEDAIFEVKVVGTDQLYSKPRSVSTAC